MRTTLVAIGNSRGVRIPKPFIKQCGLSGEIEMAVKDGSIILQSPHKARSGWDKAFAHMAKLKDDKLVDSHPMQSRFDEEDWQWK